MKDYPRRVREAAIKCIGCNAPVVETVDGGYVCVECGRSPVTARTDSTGIGSIDGEPGEAD